MNIYIIIYIGVGLSAKFGPLDMTYEECQKLKTKLETETNKNYLSLSKKQKEKMKRIGSLPTYQCELLMK